MLHKSKTYHVSDVKNSATETSEKSWPVWMIWKRRRYVVAIMALLGFANIYGLRANLSIAIVAMTAKTEIVLDNGTVAHVREFDWDSKVQGYVLSSFFYGYIVTQLAGGWLAAKFGGKHIFGMGIAVTGALTVITPVVAKQSASLLIAVRVIEGLFEGVTYPCIHAIWAEWAPPLERSRLAAIAFSGCYIGTVVAMPLSALLADKLGWESIFYVTGGIALLWYLLWCVIVTDSPSKDRYISNLELRYIQDSIGEQQVTRTANHPWKSIFMSVPVWAIIVAHFTDNWGFYTLLTQLPTFMKDTLNFDLASTGIVAAIPYLVVSVTAQISGQLADWLQEKKILNTTQVRKVFNCVAYIGQAVFLLLAGYILSPIGSTICLACAVGIGGLQFSGYGVNHLDIAPQHASVLLGISNTIATIPGIISPIVAGYIVTTPTAFEWQIVFIISSCIYVCGAIFYGFFASGELQPWAVDTNKTKDNDVSDFTF
ncbi:vesicular glutamate transporter 1-like isoform X2 [Photinus pyralis]|uniref:vesicular glutamate transporter 1-like isoform X2 n=1 Tax=Photinus pyralis TaxID=7054 RepID=UPI0012670C13|nr:vesicular glutamate transporter 1-like isoform X2 [Photinus pyralis]